MKADWTPAGGGLVNLGDDSQKWTIEIEDGPGGQCVTQTEPLYGGATQFLESRGNVVGQFVFSAARSHADLDAMATFMAAEFGRMGQKGKLEMTLSAHKWVMDNAVLKGVQRAVTEDAKGVRLKVRYTFEIVTLTYS